MLYDAHMNKGAGPLRMRTKRIQLILSMIESG